MTNVNNWMSWEGGIDLVAVTAPDLQMPNVIVHLGRMVNTPPAMRPAEWFLATQPRSFTQRNGPGWNWGKYFGPHILQALLWKCMF